jgi:hypothetical protein
VSRVAATTADAPLTPAEVAEMKEHLAYLRRYKDALRLKLNAAEDLLVNGHRDPSERGVCRHLLGKLERTVIEQAIQREPLRSDAVARARMLAGAIRVTADTGVLLAYLETLAQVRSHEEAAQAFAEVVARIDFASLSATRLGRLLQVLIDTFRDHERVQVLTGLLAAPTFCRAFDAALPTLPGGVAETLAPLRAVHRRVFEGSATEPGPLLAAGLDLMLRSPDPVLRTYPEALRTGLVELALEPGIPPALADRAAGVLLPSLARGGRAYRRLAFRRAAGLLAAHADDRARAVLEELRRAQPDARAAERWLRALSARHLGRVALDGEPPARGRLAPAFHLDVQRPVWLRTAAASDAERLANEARLQASLALPGIAATVAHGVASGIPYVAVAAPGRPLVLEGAVPDAAPALAIAAAAARILRALALAGVVLPDAAPERFLWEPSGPGTLTLADLDGARPASPDDAARAHAPLAGKLAAHLLGDACPPAAGDLPGLVAALDAAALRAGRS